MAKKRAEVERFVAEAEKICAKNRVAPNVQVHALGVLSCHLTLCALEKKHSNLPKFYESHQYLQPDAKCHDDYLAARSLHEHALAVLRNFRQIK